MTPFAEHGGGGSDAGGRRRPRRTCAASALASKPVRFRCTRVDQAARHFLREDVVEAGLIAANTDIDFVAAACAALLTNSGSARKGRAIDTMSAQPSASTCSATSGTLMRLDVMTGMPTSGLILREPRPCGARGTLVAMVGTRASCQPIPVLMIVAPAFLDGLGGLHHLAHTLPPGTRSISDKR